VIDKFDGKYRFLSNFSTEGAVLPSVEHQFQALKATTVEEAVFVMAAPTPGQAKRRGRSVQLRSDWERKKLDIMRALDFQKFSRDETAKGKLLATGDQELIEGNTWNDTFWGVCNGKGKNALGVILMAVREELATS
jgi:ribA/ribD-fused uncharacterized protein